MRLTRLFGFEGLGIGGGKADDDDVGGGPLPFNVGGGPLLPFMYGGVVPFN